MTTGTTISVGFFNFFLQQKVSFKWYNLKFILNSKIKVRHTFMSNTSNPLKLRYYTENIESKKEGKIYYIHGPCHHYPRLFVYNQNFTSIYRIIGGVGIYHCLL